MRCLREIHTFDENSSEWYLAKNILERADDGTSLGDTTFIKNFLAILIIVSLLQAAS